MPACVPRLIWGVRKVEEIDKGLVCHKDTLLFVLQQQGGPHRRDQARQTTIAGFEL